MTHPTHTTPLASSERPKLEPERLGVLLPGVIAEMRRIQTERERAE